MKIRLAVPLLAALAASPAHAQPRWTFQVSVGEVANLETSLEIRQEGSPRIELDADYENRGFESPLYYSLRAGRSGWELELIHQKLFLKNRPPEVQRFDISHGFNLVTINRAWEARGFVWRIGAGAVVAHPENEVRGRELDPGDTNLGGGYHLAGPALQAGIEKRFELGERWLLGLEGKASAARAQVPVAGGEADVPNAALHLLVGFGFRAGRPLGQLAAGVRPTGARYGLRRNEDGGSLSRAAGEGRGGGLQTIRTSPVAHSPHGREDRLHPRARWSRSTRGSEP